MGKVKKLVKGEEINFGSKAFMSSVFACLIGFIVALALMYITLLCFSYSNANSAFISLFTYTASSTDLLTSFITLAGISLLLSLGFGVGVKGNLYNFGIFGQFAVGGVLSIIGGSMFNLPWYYLALIGAAGGLVIGLIPGIMKAFLKIDESISSIVLGVICLVGAELALYNYPGLIGEGGVSLVDINSSNPSALIGSFDINGFKLGYGVLIAVGLSIVMSLALSIKGVKASTNNLYKMRFSPEMKKGHYKGAVVLTFIISGAFAGLAGSLYYVNLFATTQVHFLSITNITPSLIGMASALMTFGNPIGSIFTTGMISYLISSCQSLSYFSVSNYVIYILLGVLIVCGSVQLMVRFHLLRGVSFRRLNYKIDKKTRVQEVISTVSENKRETLSKSDSPTFEETALAKKLAVETSVPPEEKGRTQSGNIQKRLAQVLNSKKSGSANDDSFAIPLTPFSRVLKDYDSNSVSNMDDAEITRVSSEDGKEEK